METQVSDDRPTYFMPNKDDGVRRLMNMNGFRQEKSISAAQYIIFTGGADINPYLYGEFRHPSTHIDMLRDMKDLCAIKSWGGDPKKVLIGICRGAQFLNTVVGQGSLYQNCDNHAGKPHFALDLVSKKQIMVSSTHHQMMIPGKEGKILLAAREATKFEADTWDMDYQELKIKNDWEDPEAVLYLDRNTFCFQPHPEIQSPHLNDCRDFFFGVLREYFLTKKQEIAMKKHIDSLPKEAFKGWK